MENEKYISSLNELKAGDHIVLVSNRANYFHAILVNIQNGNNLEIIFYNNDKMPMKTQELIFESLKERQDVMKNYRVFKVKIVYDASKFKIYVVNYEQKLNAEQTLEKAESLVGKEKYNTFENNDEHFATFCKTGKAGKLFLVDTSKVDLKEIFGNSITDRVKNSLKSTGTNIVLMNAAQQLSTSFPRSVVVSALPSVIKNTLPLVGVGLESYSVGSDINDKYKQIKEGKLTDTKFRKFVAQKITKSTVGLAGGFGGAVVGQILIPVPIVGGMVGGIVGGVIGSAAGWAQSILVGEVVENIDNRITKLINKHPEASDAKSSVLDSLVIKFDDTIVKMAVDDLSKEELDNKIDIALQTVEEKTDEKESINQQDYDIYVIDKNTDESEKEKEDNQTVNLLLRKNET